MAKKKAVTVTTEDKPETIIEELVEMEELINEDDLKPREVSHTDHDGKTIYSTREP